MTPERVAMEPEETNNTEAPEIHYWDFQVESGNTEARKRKMNTNAFEDNGMAVAEMVNLLRAKVIQ